MKKTVSFYLLCFIWAFLISSCETDDVYSDIKTNENNSHLMAIINGMNLDTTNLYRLGDYYVIENDILIHKDSIPLYGLSMTRQARADYIIHNISMITVGVDPGLPADNDWRSAVHQAISEYNSLGLSFSFVYSDINPDILVSYYPTTPSDPIFNDLVCGTALYPSSNGLPGSSIFVNQLTTYQFSTKMKKLILAHNLGHCIGLRHTDWHKYPLNYEPTAIHIVGTTGTDSNSIMNADYCGKEWKGFSNYDKIALDALFPGDALFLSKTSIEGPSMPETNNQINYSLICPPLHTLTEIIWTVNGNIVSQNQSFNYTFNQPGTYDLKCSGIFSKGNGATIIFSKEKQVTVYPRIYNDQWHILNARVDGLNQISYDLVYKASRPHSFYDFHVIFLYRGAYDRSSIDWDWMQNSYGQWVIPPVAYDEGCLDGYLLGGSISQGQVYVKQRIKYRLSGNYNLQDIEMAFIYSKSDEKRLCDMQYLIHD